MSSAHLSSSGNSHSSRAAAAVFVAMALLLGGLLGGCSAVTIHRLTDERFPPKPANQTIRLFQGKVQDRPYQEIAFIDSQALPDQSPASREKQLLQIREAARKLGADAVHEIRYLKEKARGLVVDQNVPFKAYKQGRFDLYFVRGTAIVYTKKEVPPSPEASPTSGVGGKTPLPNSQPPPPLAPLMQGPTVTPSPK